MYICIYGYCVDLKLCIFILSSVIQPGRIGSQEIPPTWLLNSVHIVEYRFGEKEM